MLDVHAAQCGVLPVTTVIYAKDLDRVSRFYAELLGLSAVDVRAGDYSCLGSGDGDLELSIVAIPDHVGAGFVITEPPERRERAAMKPSFAVDNLDAARRRAPALGGVVDAAATEWCWRGMVHCDGHDPEGNVFQLRTEDAAQP
jgi:predicted enzyme related to lactoylglutathione lyase